MSTSLIDPVDEASTESFPASDPPAWSPLIARPPLPSRQEAGKVESLSERELDLLHAENLHGATRIVGLLLGIFGFGLLMYLSIFFWVLSGIG